MDSKHMRLCLQLVLFFAACLLVNAAEAQTLNEKLIAEDPDKLAEAARKNGDVIRGAILFHQGNIKRPIFFTNFLKMCVVTTITTKKDIFFLSGNYP